MRQGKRFTKPILLKTMAKAYNHTCNYDLSRRHEDALVDSLWGKILICMMSSKEIPYSSIHFNWCNSVRIKSLGQMHKSSLNLQSNPWT